MKQKTTNTCPGQISRQINKANKEIGKAKPEPERIAKTGTERKLNPKDQQKLDEALFDAAKSGNKTKVSELIDAGADVNAISKRGRTALKYAVESGLMKIVEMLIEYGADVKGCTNSGTPLMSAAYHGRTKIAELLLTSGAEVNKKFSDGRTALKCALLYRHSGTVEMLRKHGAKE